MQIYAFSPNNKQIMRIIYKNYGWQVFVVVRRGRRTSLPFVCALVFEVWQVEFV